MLNHPTLPFALQPVQMALSQNNSLTPELLLATAIFCIVFYVVKALRTRVPKGLKSPPGPWGWSIIGHIADPREEPTPVTDQAELAVWGRVADPHRLHACDGAEWPGHHPAGPGEAGR